jgi:CheY-like chemotaxis protein
MNVRPESRDQLRSVDVLVVDDDEAIRSTAAEILRGSGYSVAVASDGDVALRFLGQQSAGVVLLDLRMPRVDGLSVLEALTAPQLVVLVSAHSLDEVTRARVEGKVVTYLEKPVPPERLLQTVAWTLGRSEGSFPRHAGTPLEVLRPTRT